MTSKPIIAVLGGTGQEGGALALRWVRAGYRVIIGSRDNSKASAAADRINSTLRSDRASGADLRSAATQASIAVLTVPYAAQIGTLETVRDALDGKILVDVTVPLVPPKVTRVQLPEGGSAVVKAQELLGKNVRVVSAFQNISHDVLAALDRSIDCDVIVCGDDKEARETVITLARDAGMRAWHGGLLANSAAAEALTSVLIFLNGRHKVHGAGIRITGLENKRSARLSAFAPSEIPEVRPHDDLAGIILDALARDNDALQDGDVLVVAQKIVSKAEGRSRALSTVHPSPRALELSEVTHKDARLIELILGESSEVLRQREELIVVQHRRGYVLANAGIDGIESRDRRR